MKASELEFITDGQPAVNAFNLVVTYLQERERAEEGPREPTPDELRDLYRQKSGHEAQMSMAKQSLTYGEVSAKSSHLGGISWEDLVALQETEEGRERVQQAHESARTLQEFTRKQEETDV